MAGTGSRWRAGPRRYAWPPMHSTVPRVLLYAGTLAAVVGLSLVHAARHGYDYAGSSRFAWSIAYIGILALAAYGAGLPDLVQRGSGVVGTAVAAVVLAALGISAVQLFAGDALLPRFVVFGSALLLAPWYAACASVASGGRARAEDRARVLMVGDVDEGDTLRRDLVNAERPAQLVGTITADDATPRPDHPTPLADAAEAAKATVVVLSRAAQAEEAIVHQAAMLHESGVRVRTLSLFYEQWIGKLPVAELERVSLMFDIREIHQSFYGRISRAIDLVIGAAGTLVLVPVAVLVALANLAGNRGSLLYRQSRVGKNEVPFEILKFRTMRPSVDGASAVNEWTTEDDPRITPVGHVLRRSHIDELPQMVNILRGDLSLVGPRPEQPHYVRELVAKLPYYNLRHLVRPGLTGWAQVKYGYAGNESAALEKLQYEFYYLRHQSLTFDARIMVRTLRSVIGRKGR
jgi:lipopolysaccharide/colanic/teichoic acid biosynthesis glycosyltransferase